MAATAGKSPLENPVLSITTGQPSMQAFAPSVAIVGDPLAEIRVHTYGAKGNGVDDDRLAIQTAVNVGISTGGVFDLVFEPNRKYILASSGLGGGNTSVSISGLTSSARMRFVGNGANIHTTLVDGNLFYFDTAFDTVAFENLYFSRPSIPTDLLLTAIRFTPHDTNSCKLVDVNGCRFNNIERSVTCVDDVSPLRYRKLEKWRIRNCIFDHPYGSNSSEIAGRPGVAMHVSAWVDQCYADDNVFDGGADVSTSETPNHRPKDGFIVSEAHRNYFRRNTIENFWVEGLYVEVCRGFVSTSASFTVPAIGSNVTVAFYTNNYGADVDTTLDNVLAAGGNVGIGNSSSPYQPAGQYKIISIDHSAHTMVMQNTGYAFAEGGGGFISNAAATTVIGANTFIGLIDPQGTDAESFIEGNVIDHKRVIGGPTRGNPCIAMYMGRGHILGNTIRNSKCGIVIGHSGEAYRALLPSSLDKTEVKGNTIEMENWNAEEGSREAIGYYLGANRCITEDNTIIVPQSKGITGIWHTQNAKVLKNNVIADGLVFDALYPSYATRARNGSAGAFLDKNYIENFDEGLGSPGASFIYGESNVVRGCTLAASSVGVAYKSKANFSAVAATTQAGIANATWTKLLVPTEQWDDTNAFAGSAFTTQYVSRVLFRFALKVGANASGLTQIALWKNGVGTGTQYNVLEYHNYSTAETWTGSMALALGLFPNNYVELALWQNSGSTMTVDLTATQGFFQGNELR